MVIISELAQRNLSRCGFTIDECNEEIGCSICLLFIMTPEKPETRTASY